MSARLFVLSGRDLGRSFPVEEGGLCGRAEDCDVRLSDRSISRHHARLRRSEGGFSIVDLDSRNGVWVGGQRVAEAPLADLAEFRLGEVLLRLRLSPAAPEAGEPSAPGPEAESEPGVELEEEVRLDPAAAGQAPGPTQRELARARLLRPERGGLWTGDLEQRPGWQRGLLVLLALAVSGGVAWAVFRAVLGVRRGLE